VYNGSEESKARAKINEPPLRIQLAPYVVDQSVFPLTYFICDSDSSVGGEDHLEINISPRLNGVDAADSAEESHIQLVDLHISAFT
jgi:hypothetical protein